MYLLTRPLPKLAASKSVFEEHGVEVTGIATTDIRMLENWQQASSALVKLSLADIIIVTSTFAAKAICNQLAGRAIPATVVAVGSSTAQILRASGVTPCVPPSQDSDGVLAMPALQQSKNKLVLLVKGEGGRTLIRDTLQRRGARVEEILVYQRITLEQPKETNHWQWEDVKGIIATSQEMAAPLFSFYDKEKLTGVPWLTVSARIMEFLSLQGVEQVAIASGASDEALIKWIKENWE